MAVLMARAVRRWCRALKQAIFALQLSVSCSQPQWRLPSPPAQSGPCPTRSCPPFSPWQGALRGESGCVGSLDGHPARLLRSESIRWLCLSRGARRRPPSVAASLFPPSHANIASLAQLISIPGLQALEALLLHLSWPVAFPHAATAPTERTPRERLACRQARAATPRGRLRGGHQPAVL